MKKMLILGEGNFSFTKCISTDPNYSFEIISTSIDSLSDLQKYKEFDSIKAKISKNKNILLRHGINALEIDSVFGGELFDLIQWNHPHLGYEDFRVHQRLLKHFLYAAAKILNSDGFVKVTLVRGQESRWNLVEIANELGLELDRLEYFDEDALHGFITKRNMHDKSFKNKHTQRHVRHSMVSFTYYLSHKRKDIANGGKSVQEQLDMVTKALVDFDEQTKLKLQGLKDEELKVLAKAVKADRELPAIDTSIPVRVQKDDKLRELQCPYCRKQLFCQRGYKQHVHQVHELEKFPDYLKPNPVDCKDCGKSFNGQEALFQHSINKHKQLDEVLADLTIDSKLTQSATEQIAGASDCFLCGYQLKEGETCIDQLRPPGSDELECRCGKVVINERALTQHFKFCSLKSTQPAQ